MISGFIWLVLIMWLVVGVKFLPRVSSTSTLSEDAVTILRCMGPLGFVGWFCLIIGLAIWYGIIKK